MATVCNTRATLTSASVSTGYRVATSSRNVVYSAPGATYIVPATTTICTTTRATLYCAAYYTSRYSVAPPRVYTSAVVYATSIPVYYTSYVTLYSTSCSVSPRTTYTPPPITTTTRTAVITTPTTQTTTYIPNPTTTTQTSVITSVPNPSYITTTATDTTTETPVLGTPAVGPTPTPVSRKSPVGAIVGGVLGGVVAAFLIGLALYFLLFRNRNKENKEVDDTEQDNSQELNNLPRTFANMDGQSSPSEGSSGAQFEMYEQPAGSSQFPKFPAGQGYHYSHLRQDSLGGGLPIGAAAPALGVNNSLPTIAGDGRSSLLSASSVPADQQVHYSFNPATGQYYYNVAHAGVQESSLSMMDRNSVVSSSVGVLSEQGQYLGHAEIQDSKW